MAWTKVKTAIVAGVVVVLATGATTVTVKHIQNHNDDKWDVGQPLDSRKLNKMPHIVRIIPTKFPDEGGWVGSNNRALGVNDTAREIVLAAYGGTETRTIFSAPLPEEKYDFISNMNSPGQETFKDQIKKQFSVAGRQETIETNVLFLRVKQANAPGLKKVKSARSTSWSSKDGEYKSSNGFIGFCATYLEQMLQTPVIDQTGLKGNYDIDLTWDNQTDPQENIKKALSDQLGLELVPGIAPIDYLIVEKAN
jgi:uncharacterized protein (TIGR03435 family)